MIASQPETRPRRYTTLWILIGLFSLPYALAALFWFTEDLRESLPLANHGTLISPLRPLPDVALATRDPQRRFEPAALRGQWLLLYVNTDRCDRVCEHTLYYLRQVRLAMGKQRFDIERAAVLPAATEPRIFGELARHQPAMYVIESSQAGELVSALGPGADRGGRLYVVDREGRAALYHDEVTDPKALLDDLKRLIGARNRA